MGKTQPRVVRLGSVTSTQDIARDLPIGAIVVADHQEAGRGRGDKRWEAAPGTALLVSFVVPPHPILSLAAGVAAAEACGPEVRLKWPNDLMLDGRKLGGILVEVSPARAVCGIGINLTSAPVGAAMLQRPADELLSGLVEKMDLWCSAPPEAVVNRWRELSATLGRRVRVELAGESFEGVAEDIGAGGELIVGGRPFVVGSVTYL
ncbi:MAG TPA: biotin--[acetyl-CoA-carboxylase] ligase [Candidatus Dormibacteraeota bacterium]|nr:biotin--[acetyl-CoA-carboxylase] ligase [Candidatus Dormibacteraeota bacterium]